MSVFVVTVISCASMPMPMAANPLRRIRTGDQYNDRDNGEHCKSVRLLTSRLGRNPWDDIMVSNGAMQNNRF